MSDFSPSPSPSSSSSSSQQQPKKLSFNFRATPSSSSSTSSSSLNPGNTASNNSFFQDFRKKSLSSSSNQPGSPLDLNVSSMGVEPERLRSAAIGDNHNIMKNHVSPPPLPPLPPLPPPSPSLPSNNSNSSTPASTKQQPIPISLPVFPLSSSNSSSNFSSLNRANHPDQFKTPTLPPTSAKNLNSSDAPQKPSAPLSSSSFLPSNSSSSSNSNSINSSNAPQQAGTNSIIVNSAQKGNPVLKYIRNVRWEYQEDITPDYILGRTTCAFYISLKYHMLHREYMVGRVQELGQQFKLRLILALVDIPDPTAAINLLTKLSIAKNATLILAWSKEEVARYLETFKTYEHKSADLLQGKPETSYIGQLTNAMAAVKAINKSDVDQLVRAFGNLKEVILAKPTELQICFGIGENKIEKMKRLFQEPFRKKRKTAPIEGARVSSSTSVPENTLDHHDVIDDLDDDLIESFFEDI